MRTLIEWLDNATNVSPEERATLANLRLFVSGQNACLHLDCNRMAEALTAQLYSLAEGLAFDWWRIFGGRDREFSLSSYRMGTATPDLRFHFDGASFELAVVQKTYTNPDVRFWGGTSEVMLREEAETTFTAFIEQVLDRLCSKGLTRTSAALRWSRVKASMEDPDERVFCEASGALDVDPYQIDDVSADLIHAGSEYFSGEALLEFLGGVRGRKDWSSGVLKWLSDATRRQKYQARLPGLRDAVQVSSRSSSSDDRAWALGYRKARAARKTLDIKPTKEIPSFSWLAGQLGAPHFRLAREVDGLVAMRDDRDDGVYVHLRRQGKDEVASSTGHNFAFARAIGDAFCFPQPQRSVVNDLKNAHKQAAGRAFAAEFLAPVDAVLALRSKGRDVTSIAAQFAVSPAVIERQVENAERIREVCGT